MYEFAFNLGLAFQIIDDILDYSLESKNLGKNIGDDFYEQKITLPVILLYNNSSDNEKLELENIFNSEEATRDKLNYVLTELEHKDILKQCFNYAKNHIDKALNLWNNFPECKSREILKNICHITINRSF